ncbi:MAG: 16S rRNA (uracil(1498)-N(3))-methyltransferase [Pseudomonadota bacterium]
MNLLLLHESDFISDDTAQLEGRRADHLIKVLKVQVGSSLTSGRLNGLIGRSVVQSIESGCVTVQCSSEFSDAPPAPSHTQLLLALPRPNMLRRILHHATELGVKDIHLFQSKKVEKSFWQSPMLSDEKIHEALCLGLEQSIDTRLPTVTYHKQLAHFLARLPEIKGERIGYVAHPYNASPCPHNLNQPNSLVIGPEGGFTHDEVTVFNENGFTSIGLGQRILRVENAVSTALSRIAYWP